jgi:hypothetical protein
MLHELCVSNLDEEQYDIDELVSTMDKSENSCILSATGNWFMLNRFWGRLYVAGISKL